MNKLRQLENQIRSNQKDVQVKKIVEEIRLLVAPILEELSEEIAALR